MSDEVEDEFFHVFFSHLLPVPFTFPIFIYRVEDVPVSCNISESDLVMDYHMTTSI